MDHPEDEGSIDDNVVACGIGIRMGPRDVVSYSYFVGACSFEVGSSDVYVENGTEC